MNNKKEIVDKTSLEALMKNVKGEYIHRFIDDEDVTLYCEDLLEFLQNQIILSIIYI